MRPEEQREEIRATLNALRDELVRLEGVSPEVNAYEAAFDHFIRVHSAALSECPDVQHRACAAALAIRDIEATFNARWEREPLNRVRSSAARSAKKLRTDLARWERSLRLSAEVLALTLPDKWPVQPTMPWAVLDACDKLERFVKWAGEVEKGTPGHVTATAIATRRLRSANYSASLIAEVLGRDPEAVRGIKKHPRGTDAPHQTKRRRPRVPRSRK